MPINAMQIVAATMTGYPKIGLRENTGMISDANAKAGMYQNVDFRMPEDPEKVHPKGRRASGLSIEEVPAKVTIYREHHLSGREG